MATTLLLVKPSDIQSELNRIWESLQTTNTTRACLFNLIFYTEKNTRSSYIQRIAQSVIQKFPARVIFINVDKGSEEDYLQTKVSILSASKGEYDVACDFIQVEAAGQSRERIPFVILPHILSDLPVYLVWGEDPCQKDVLFQQIAKLAQRLIFDSESTSQLSQFASTILTSYVPNQCDIADLNWARIESWRDMLSSAFHSNEKLKQLSHVSEIQINYNSQSTAFFCHTRIQALYLQAWLSAQLGWEFQKVTFVEELLVFQYKTPFRLLEIKLAPISYAQIPPGLILSLELKTDQGDHFSFQRNIQFIHQIEMIFSNADHCDMPCKYIFAKAESGHSLVKEICHRGTSDHFLKTLQFLKTMDLKNLC